MSEEEVLIEAAASPWIVFASSMCVIVFAALACRGLESSNGRDWKAHLIYWGVAVAVMAFLPFSIAKHIFSGLTLTLVGTVFPIYEALRAVCTVDEEDDKEWLIYWMVGGVLFMLSTWVDDVIHNFKNEEIWYEVMTFLFFWMYFPKTKGAQIIFELIIEPYLGPYLQPIKDKISNVAVYVYQTLINAVHLWILWIVFIILPSGLKRFVSIAVGTVFPFVSSVIAASTEEKDDDTYWLTYWACYGCLFLLMDISETWLGWIPGFYTLIILTTVYLMVPMFNGSEKVFRKILVPIAGLTELLLMRDAIVVRQQIFKDVPPERATKLRKALAKYYDDDDEKGDTEALKNEIHTGWGTFALPAFRNPFSSSEADGVVNEETNLV